VLAHGWTLSIAIWARLLNRLSRDFRVVAYDQRGHGASATAGPAGFTIEAVADDLATVLTATVPRGRRALLAGHSMGAMSMIAMGVRHPHVLRDRVAAGVLMSTGMHELLLRHRIVPLPLPLAKLAKPLSVRVMGMPPPGRVDGRLRTMTRYVTLSRQATDAEVDFSTRVINACPPRTRAGFARMLGGLDLDEEVGRFDVPAIVVAGDRDRLTPIWHARRMAAALPQGLGLVTVPGAGHMTPVEAHRAVDGAVRRLAGTHLTEAPTRIDVTRTALTASSPPTPTSTTGKDEEIVR